MARVHTYNLRGGTTEHHRKRCFLKVTASRQPGPVEAMSWHPPPAGVIITTGATRSAVCRDSPGGEKAFGIMLLQRGWNQEASTFLEWERLFCLQSAVGAKTGGLLLMLFLSGTRRAAARYKPPTRHHSYG